MITIFGDFCQFSAIFANFLAIFANFLAIFANLRQKMAFFSKTNVMKKFLQKTSSSQNYKKPIFRRKCFLNRSQILLIFSTLAIVYFRQFCWKNKHVPLAFELLFLRKSDLLNLTKLHGLGHIFGDFFT
jgi:hypothetical protein